MVTKRNGWVQVKIVVISTFYTTLLHLTAFDSLQGPGRHGESMKIGWLNFSVRFLWWTTSEFIKPELVEQPGQF
jgi:hypothetical protein